MTESALKKLTSPKKKKAAVGAKRATSFAQLQLGEEPQLLVADKMDLVRAFNWYNVFADDEQRLKWVVGHMLSEPGFYAQNDIDLMQARGKKLSATFAYLARLIARGCSLDDEHRHRLRSGIHAFLLKHRTAQDIEFDSDGMPIYRSVAGKPKASITRRTPDYSESLSLLVGQIENEFEHLLNQESYAGSCYEFLKKADISIAQAQELKNYFAPLVAEFTELVEGEPEEQLQEAYAYLSRSTRRIALAWLRLLLADLQNLTQIKKASRNQAVRRRKPTSALKQTSRLKYQKDSSEFKVVSFAPEKIIGAKAILVFNTKYRLITLYEASDQNKGLGVKGTTLTDYAEAASLTKKSRQPETLLPELLATSKIGCRTLFGRLSTKAIPATGRINSDTILLKVFG